ncbi:hypothetical protein ACS0PU_008618 [Formica fusca]
MRFVDSFARTLYRRDAALWRRARRSEARRSERRTTSDETRRGGGEERCSRDSWQPVAKGHARSSRRSCTRRLVVGGYRDVLILPRVPRGEIDTRRDPFPFPFLSFSLSSSSLFPPCFRARWVRHSSISSRRTCRRQKKKGEKTWENPSSAENWRAITSRPSVREKLQHVCAIESRKYFNQSTHLWGYISDKLSRDQKRLSLIQLIC